MRRQMVALATIVLASSACGKIRFDEPLEGDRDAGVERDGGPPPRDAGPRDAGPMGDAGCIPHTLPGMPSSWPWEESREAIEALFLQDFNANNCQRCHAAGAAGAEVVFARLAPAGPLMPPYDSEYAETKDNLWGLLMASEPATFDTAAPVGRLWFHHPNFDPGAEDNDPIYDQSKPGEAMLVARINRLFERASACSNTAYTMMPADAGTSCGEGPPMRDGGVVDGGMVDGGAVDGGARDAGTSGGGGGLCYCEVPMLNYTPDLLLYCQ